MYLCKYELNLKRFLNVVIAQLARCSPQIWTTPTRVGLSEGTARTGL